MKYESDGKAESGNHTTIFPGESPAFQSCNCSGNDRVPHLADMFQVPGPFPDLALKET